MTSRNVQQTSRKTSDPQINGTRASTVTYTVHDKFNYNSASRNAGGVKDGRRYGKDAFSDYERTTVDAWDANDDDLSVSTSSQLSFRDDAKDVTIPSAKPLRSPPCNGSDLKLPLRKVTNGMSLPELKELTGRSYSAPCSPSRNQPVDGTRRDRFDQILSDSSILNLTDLRSICWNGIPSDYRPTAWKMLCGYMPASVERREAAVDRKRAEYHGFVERYYNVEKFSDDNETYHQICTDVPRMSPLVALFQQTIVREMFERILYIWAVRHPGSGYVQGINDLVTPYFVVYLGEYVPRGLAVDKFEVSTLSEDCRRKLEADCYWCFASLLDSIHDSYTFAQPGIQRSVSSLAALIRRIDSALHSHLQSSSVDYIQFSFRWMNNLLTRELPLRCIVRLWDTYLAEPPGDFATFHVYVCASFLTRFSAQVRAEKDFHGLMTLLQNLPTRRWTENDISLLLAEAYRLRFTFEGAPNHLDNNNTCQASNKRTVASKR